MSEINQNVSSSDIDTLIQTRIENLRPKLLDFSARNPLIQTRFSEKGAAHIRVVDELPDILFHKLKSGQSMRITPLPDLNTDPKDESNEVFQSKAAIARRVDEKYLKEIDSLDQDEDGYLDKIVELEREMKDRVREKLGMPKRQTKTSVDIKTHARNNQINPSFDLALPAENLEEDKYTDSNIQTLVLPINLERRLNSIRSKDSSFAQETGINVLHAAFGFLEWIDPKSQKKNLSPLILMPIRFEVKKTPQGGEIWATSSGEDPVLNQVLCEKLRLEFGVELPSYQGGSIENYLVDLSREDSGNLQWNPRRYIAFGIFPSSRMAMYYDLDTKNNNFSQNTILSGLFAGNPVQTTAVFAEDHDVDSRENVIKIPYLVKEADASQLSTLIDISDGKNLAVEGPPGTGKSQTIVNAIAAALSQNKKVLFVAEKTAALEVVQSRLEAVGLGEFALPLIAGRSTRDAVLKSVRMRMDIVPEQQPISYERELNRYSKVREQLSEYSRILSSTHSRADVDVQTVLGNSISTALCLESHSDKIQFVDALPEKRYDTQKLDDLKVLATSYVASWERVKGDDSIWRYTNRRNLVKFQIEKILRLAEEVANAYDGLVRSYDELDYFGIQYSIDGKNITETIDLANAYLGEAPDTDNNTTQSLLSFDNPQELLNFSNSCKIAQLLAPELKTMWVDKDKAKLAENMRELEKRLFDLDLQNIPIGQLEQVIKQKKEVVEKLEQDLQKFTRFSTKIGSEVILSVHDTNLAHDIVVNAGHEVLNCRSETAKQAGFAKFLRQICEQGQKLRNQLQQIDNLFVKGVQIDPIETYSDLSTLKNAGSFRVFSTEFRKAKKRYLAIARDNNFDLAKAIANLQMYIEFTTEQKTFSENPRAISLLGLQFDGINSDFDTLEKLANFYDEIDLNFPKLEQQPINSYLKDAPIAELLSLTKIDESLSEQTTETIHDYVRIRVQEKDTLTALSKYLDSNIDDITTPDSTNAIALRAAINQLQEFQSITAAVEEHKPIKELLCNDYKGWQTNTPIIDFVAKWLQKFDDDGQIGSSARKIVRSEDPSTTIEKFAELYRNVEISRTELEKLCEEGGLPFDDISKWTPSKIADVFRAATTDDTKLKNYSELADCKYQLSDVGFAWVIEEIEDNDISRLPEIIDAMVWRVLSEDIYKEYGAELAQFSGNRLNELRARLVELDRKILTSARNHLKSNLIKQASPPYGVGVGRKSEYTELALLEHQLSLKKPSMPLRKLTKQAGRALLELKPCWMMSPLAVAQYLEKDNLEFDLCIIDEASQMRPEDAVGALARSKQAVIVGDTNQLPPSNFFRSLMEDNDADEDEQTVEESILEMANSTFRPKRRLKWHYRSRHSSLIKLSNRLVYDDKLIIFPSPDETRIDRGVFFEKVDGTYKSGLNSTEAEAIALAATDFMQKYPKRSLGIVALNKIQTEQIDSLIYEASLKNKTVREYRDYWEDRQNGIERFFVKNLENVQGDERDVIFISTVYGPSEKGGKTAQRFGPINGLAGKRRLNVLFSRAKEQIKTFSSMTAADILADPVSNPGVNMLKQWLEYSATGNLDGGFSAQNAEPDSEFERHVISVINGFGLEAVPQVGVSGYFIDIGIKHPEWPHGFLLGVECDGASYHSSKSARDRDRLRQEVLEGLGWHFHRIWSTDWFNDHHGATIRLREAIEERLKFVKSQTASSSTAIVEPDNEPPITTHPTDLDDRTESHQIDGIDPTLPDPVSINSTHISAENNSFADDQTIEIGDRVRVRLTSDKDKILEFTISNEVDNIGEGILYFSKPLAQAVIDKDEGEEFEYLVGSYVKNGVIEQIKKATP